MLIRYQLIHTQTHTKQYSPEKFLTRRKMALNHQNIHNMHIAKRHLQNIYANFVSIDEDDEKMKKNNRILFSL